MGKNKAGFRKNIFKLLLAVAVVVLCCALGYYIYNLPAFWAKPATAEYSPEEGKGLYLGMPTSEIKAVKGPGALFKRGKWLVKSLYYEKKLKGKYFDNGYYALAGNGRLSEIGFSRHLKAEQLDKEKYEILKYFISKYGADYKKGLRIIKPSSNTRFLYEMFIWDKKDARITLEFSFYNNDKTVFLCKDNGIYLNINYPKDTRESRTNKITVEQEDRELMEAFKLHFPELEKKTAEPAVPVK